MKKYRILISLMLLCTAGLLSLAAQPQVASEPGKTKVHSSELLSHHIPLDPAVRIGELPNGMKYYIRRNAKPENRAELRLAVAAGSVQEDEDQLGLAHFVEHMAFNGSEHFTKNELVDYLESVGTRFGPDLNAYTSFDETVYMLQVRTDDTVQLMKGLLVLQDWAGGIAFDEEEIDKERGVVISEWRTRLSAEQRMQQEYFPKLFYQSRYATRLPIGEPEIIENASYETVRQFYRDWYRPDLMAVCVVGDIDPDEMEMEIRARFSGLTNPATPRPREYYSVPGHPQTLVSVLTDKEATATNIRMMYKHKYNNPETVGDYRETLLHQLYNRMLNARLYEVNNTADPPFVFAYSGYGQSVGDLATYSSFARVPEAGIERAFTTLLAENERVRRHGFVSSELERQKVEMMTSAERAVREADKTESSRHISNCVYHFLENNPMPAAQQELDLYASLLPTISVDEINALAKKWITEENRVIVLTGPEKEGFVLPDEGRLLEIIGEVEASDIEPYTDNVSDAPLFDKELNPVPVQEVTLNESLDIRALDLANGIRVIYKHTDFKNDQVLFSGFSWGGTSLYDDEVYPSSQAIGSVIRESGLSEFDAPQLNKKLTGKTVSVFPFIGERYEGFNGACSPQDLEVLFQLIYLYATAPRMEDQALQAYVKKQHSILENLLSNPNNYFGDVVNQIRYQGHPRRMIPRAEDLARVEMAQMQQIYADRFADMGDFTFIFTGAFDPAILKELSAKYLGNLPSADRDETWKDIGVSSPDGTIDTLFHKGAAPRSNVRIIYHGDFEWKDESRFALNMLTGYARIKLRESLREDMGGVYGVAIYSSASKDPDPEYSINISFNSDPPMTASLIEAVESVIAEIQKGNITESDVQKVAELERQERIKDLKENRFWHSGMTTHWMEGTPLDHLTQDYLESKLETLNPGLIQAASSKYFGNNKIEVVMHPEE